MLSEKSEIKISELTPSGQDEIKASIYLTYVYIV